MSDVETAAETPKELERHEARFAILDSPIQGRGAFAVKFIAKGETIAEYTGERIGKEESGRRCEAGNPYIFQIDDTTDLDGNVPDNAARFINHSCAPNCEALDYDGRIWIEAIRDIRPGEELTFNYGYGLADYQDHPCGCGQPNCLGYIVAVEHQDHVRAELARRTRRPDRPRTKRRSR